MSDVPPSSSRRLRPSFSAPSQKFRLGFGAQENATIDMSALADSQNRPRNKSAVPNRRASLAGPMKQPPRSILKPSLPQVSELGGAQDHTSSRLSFGGNNTLHSFNFSAVQADPDAEKKERERREARRKSLANRRVSFANEATLHTFHDIEYIQPRNQPPPPPSSTPHHPPQTPQPPKQPPLYQQNTPAHVPSQSQAKDTRRSSILSNRRNSVNSSFDTTNDDLDDTMFSGDDDDDDDGQEDIEEFEDSDSDSASDSDSDGTMMTVDVEEMTSGFEDDEYELDDALRLAAQHAGTQTIAREIYDTDDDTGDKSDRTGEEEIIPSFGWIKKPQTGHNNPPANPPPKPIASDNNTSQMSRSLDSTQAVGGLLQKTRPSLLPNRNMASPRTEDTTQMSMDLDMTQALGGIVPNTRPTLSRRQDSSPATDDATMDVTKPLGGILPRDKPVYLRMPLHSQPGVTSRHRETTPDEPTMDFTIPMGGIYQSSSNPLLPPPPNQYASKALSVIEGSDNEDENENESESDPNEEMTMDFTTAVGNVLRQPSTHANPTRQSRGFSSSPSQTMDVTMDMTKGIGQIIGASSQPALTPNRSATNGNVTSAMDLTMDMTVPMGRILSNVPRASHPNAAPRAASPSSDEASSPEEATATMEMTTAVGNILQPSQTRLNQQTTRPSFPLDDDHTQDMTSGMDVTTALGGILPSKQQPTLVSPKKRRRSSTMAQSPGGSPASASPKRRTSLRRSLLGTKTVSEFIQSSAAQSQAALDPNSPSAGLYPDLPMLHNDDKVLSPLNKNNNNNKTTAPGTKSPGRHHTMDYSPHRTPEFFRTGYAPSSERTPSKISTPQDRILSGVGADRTGLGSPKVVEILSRRESISEASSSFVPGTKRGVSFRSFDDDGGSSPRNRDPPDDTTANLRNMIGTLSPKKKPNLRGRKSLHVGSAKGLLGKRPAELESDSEASSSSDGVKRLKGHMGSPVKRVHLRQPPSMEETIGRPASPRKQQQEYASPQRPRRHLASPSLEPPSPYIPPMPEYDDPNDSRIHLHTFLDMISVRFMELTTTKRRATIAPSSLGTAQGLDGDTSLEKCVVTAASTVPMLELYQHSCRELKKYISEGRRIVREIELETFEDNPPLFQEYMEAPPDVKHVMDTQFKNVKTHSRLLSKAMWYEWRTKLQEGLLEGLEKIADDMDADEEQLQRQRDIIQAVLPALQRKDQSLERELEDLEEVVRELESCDPRVLEEARHDLVALDDDIVAKTEEIEELRRQIAETSQQMEAVSQEKTECQEAIQEAERIREECRGWSVPEIRELRARVERLEKETGWAATQISQNYITLSYRREVEVGLNLDILQKQTPTLSTTLANPKEAVDIWYAGTDHKKGTLKATTPLQTFFLGWIRKQLQASNLAEAAASTPSALPSALAMVSQLWDKCVSISAGLKELDLSFPTEITYHPPSSSAHVSPRQKKSDAGDHVTIRTSILIIPLRTKVDIVLPLRAVLSSSSPGRMEVEVEVEPKVEIVYGEKFHVGKMVDFLCTRLGTKVADGSGPQQQQQPRRKSLGAKQSSSSKVRIADARWSPVFVEFQDRLLARAKRDERLVK